MDISTIRPGDNFAEAITAAVGSCNLLLALIGREWLTILNRHAGDPERDDWTRFEIKTAIEHKIPIVPVLVDRATLPEMKELPEELRQLGTRQALEITDSRWDFDVNQLIEVVRQRTHNTRRVGKIFKLAALIASVVILSALSILAIRSWPHDGRLPVNLKSVVVDYSKVDTHASGDRVAAAPYLHDFGISVVDRTPSSSKVVLINNEAVYNGDAIRPTTSQNFLTQVDTSNTPASFTLRFSDPLESVEFVIPALYPASESGVTYPAWSAHALDAANSEPSSQGESITRSFRDVPPRHYILRAPGLDGIVAVRFDSDPRLDGIPFAGFSAVFIEQLTLTHRSSPTEAPRR